MTSPDPLGMDAMVPQHLPRARQPCGAPTAAPYSSSVPLGGRSEVSGIHPGRSTQPQPTSGNHQKSPAGGAGRLPLKLAITPAWAARFGSAAARFTHKTAEQVQHPRFTAGADQMPDPVRHRRWRDASAAFWV